MRFLARSVQMMWCVDSSCLCYGLGYVWTGRVLVCHSSYLLSACEAKTGWQICCRGQLESLDPSTKITFLYGIPQKPLKTYCIFVGTFSFHRVETTTITASLAGTSNTPGLLWCGSRDAVVGYSRSMSSQCWQETQAELRTILGCYHSSSLPCSHW